MKYYQISIIILFIDFQFAISQPLKIIKYIVISLSIMNLVDYYVTKHTH